MLNKIMNPTRAPMESQNPHSPVNKPLDIRIALPTVGASIIVSLFGCSKKKTIINPKLKKHLSKISILNPGYIKKNLVGTGTTARPHDITY
jgi:hypothetical protein